MHTTTWYFDQCGIWESFAICTSIIENWVKKGLALTVLKAKQQRVVTIESASNIHIWCPSFFCHNKTRDVTLFVGGKVNLIIVFIIWVAKRKLTSISLSLSLSFFLFNSIDSQESAFFEESRSFSLLLFHLRSFAMFDLSFIFRFLLLGIEPRVVLLKESLWPLGYPATICFSLSFALFHQCATLLWQCLLCFLVLSQLTTYTRFQTQWVSVNQNTFGGIRTVVHARRGHVMTTSLSLSLRNPLLTLS